MSQPHVACSWALPIEIIRGEGCELIDREGKRYIDFTGGWCVGTLGWGNHAIAQAVKEEAERALYVPPTLEWKGWEELASLLTEIAPGKLARAIRCCSGSEAVEFAMKCARAATGRDAIISVSGVYHGHTYGAASVGNALGRKMGPGVPGCKKIPMPKNERTAKESLALLEKLLKKGDVAAFLSEPIWSNAGGFVPPPDFYPAVQNLCRKHGALFAMDEVAVGFGRTGKLFASEHFALTPDILCLGKALTGGYAALGATLVTEDVFQKSQGIPDYVTFGWTPINAAAALANVRAIVEKRLWENAEHIGGKLLGRLKKLEGSHHVREVRGIGLLIGIALNHMDATALQQACLDRGLYLESWNEEDGSAFLFLSPPLMLDEETANRGAEIIEEVLTKAA